MFYTILHLYLCNRQKWKIEHPHTLERLDFFFLEFLVLLITLGPDESALWSGWTSYGEFPEVNGFIHNKRTSNLDNRPPCCLTVLGRIRKFNWQRTHFISETLPIIFSSTRQLPTNTHHQEIKNLMKMEKISPCTQLLSTT